MKLYTFKNKKCVIFGSDVTRIECDKEGVLRIGATEINLSPGSQAVLPALANGTYKPLFTEKNGTVYYGEPTVVKSGRLASPPQEIVELLELKSKYEVLEDDFETLRRDMDDLKKAFDTDALNFLIK